MTRFTRYVAIGDSQTEGLWDGDDAAGLVGFADRLAATLDTFYPGLLYANLAVRGRRVRDVLREQVPLAVQMRPDLVTVCVGMNDVTRPGRSFDGALTDLAETYARLADTGATVATTTFPDVARIVPIGRLMAARVEQINTLIRSSAHQYGFRLVDLYAAESMVEPDTWSPDRVHGSAKGHILFAQAAAEALGLPGSNHAWAHAAGDAEPTSRRAQVQAQWQWTRHMLVPWIWRHLRGRSSGDGRPARRPVLQAVAGSEAEQWER